MKRNWFTCVPGYKIIYFQTNPSVFNKINKNLQNYKMFQMTKFVLLSCLLSLIPSAENIMHQVGECNIEAECLEPKSIQFKGVKLSKVNCKALLYKSLECVMTCTDECVECLAETTCNSLKIDPSDFGRRSLDRKQISEFISLALKATIILSTANKTCNNEDTCGEGSGQGYRGKELKKESLW